jgi:NAD(P)-dependent dehydrogenase (short-subunit alcohol dehydrogenase family)
LAARVVCLAQAALGAQSHANLLYARLAFAQRGVAGVHLVVTSHQVVWMFDRRAQDERSIALRNKVNGSIGFLEYRERLYGTSQEIAATVLHLAASESAYIVGTEIIADGGMAQL